MTANPQGQFNFLPISVPLSCISPKYSISPLIMSEKSTLRLGASTEDGQVAHVANENRELGLLGWKFKRKIWKRNEKSKGKWKGE